MSDILGKVPDIREEVSDGLRNVLVGLGKVSDGRRKISFGCGQG